MIFPMICYQPSYECLPVTQHVCDTAAKSIDDALFRFVFTSFEMNLQALEAALINKGKVSRPGFPLSLDHIRS